MADRNWAKPCLERGSKAACLCYVLRHNKRLLIPPTILLVLILGLCIFAVVYATNDRVHTQKKLMDRAASAVVEAMQLQLNVLAGTLRAMATFVRMDPEWKQLSRDFPVVAREVLQQVSRQSERGLGGVLYLPFGIVSAVFPLTETTQAALGVDAFVPRFRDFRTLETIKRRVITFSGPLMLFPDTPQVILARLPVFLTGTSEDEAWGNPHNMTAPTNCPAELCYNSASQEKFWGFVTAWINADQFFTGRDNRFANMRSHGYAYRMTRRIVNLQTDQQEQGVIVEHGSFVDKASARVAVDIPGLNWQLEVFNPDIKSTQEAQKGLIALVVVAAVVLSGLLLLLLTVNRKAALLLEEQLDTTGKLETANCHLEEAKRVLEDEKQQRETLLERQVKLMACFEQACSRRSQPRTLDSIAEARRRLSESRAPDHQDIDVQILELLGEGTYGRVHRGIWRGFMVAVKIILLPANMSGAEKREKMVVWEAAISSSLMHPNIVQTYTYSVTPVKENDRHDGTDAELEGLGAVLQFCNSDHADKEGSDGEEAGGSLRFPDGSDCTQRSSIHSFEVQLVLEYCDKGCLRDALDQEVFMDDTGLNYPAILDCAIDIARAMLHLHCNNVLHMDLKARNIMLASSGIEDKGVSCKVADFGLAVRMGTMETHMSDMFQGTATHMAPEVLLEGRVSKLADVYAFGITLWELFTGGQPYKGVPKALLGHKVVKEHLRPCIPLVIPPGYKALMVKCWSHRPEQRPGFMCVLKELQALRQGLPGPTPMLQPIKVGPFQPRPPPPMLVAPKVARRKGARTQQEVASGMAAEASRGLSNTQVSSVMCLKLPPAEGKT